MCLKTFFPESIEWRVIVCAARIPHLVRYSGYMSRLQEQEVTDAQMQPTLESGAEELDELEDDEGELQCMECDEGDTCFPSLTSVS